VFQFASEQNDDGDPRGDNYWGYMRSAGSHPIAAMRRTVSPGGPTRSSRPWSGRFTMPASRSFSTVVYKPYGRGRVAKPTRAGPSDTEDEIQIPSQACLLSLRGLDNASYYTLRSRPDLDGGRTLQRYQDNSACGPNLNVTIQPSKT